ncbi:MAG: hypothetical protein GXP26_04985 [Planctomycetes bacterium]|nr:hypothetical protein [Planctomycetota bacterium]
MKIGTLHHPKTKRLARLLDVPSYAAVGILESIWHLTSEAADEGDIGRFSDDEIADYIGWEHDSAQLIKALIESRWLDEHTEDRLSVHDWVDHCPGFVTERLKKRRARAAKKQKRDQTETTSDEQETGKDIAGTTEGQPGDKSKNVPSIPRPSKPRPSKSIPSTSNWEEVEEELILLKVGAAPAAVREAKARGLTPSDATKLIAQYRASPGAWGPGALYDRLAGIRAGWPPRDEKYQRNQRRDETDRRFADQQAETDRANREAADERKRFSEREAKYGPDLDVMPEDEVKALLESAVPNENERKFLGKKMKRAVLLQALAEMNGAPA